jgi:hypothetical protein
MLTSSVRSHVKKDLDAYICLFEDCDTPEDLYNHSDEWLKHMRRYALRRRCNSKSHGLLVFVTRDEYVNHMSKVHKGAFTDAQVRVLSESNARTIGPLFDSCPLSGFDEVKGGPLEDHIVGHLRFLALKYLPPYQDEIYEGSESGNGTLRASKPPSRSTIKFDPERHVKPVFEDIGNQSSIERPDNVNNTSPSPYEPWGGFKSYLSKSLDVMRGRDSNPIFCRSRLSIRKMRIMSQRIGNPISHRNQKKSVQLCLLKSLCSMGFQPRSGGVSNGDLSQKLSNHMRTSKMIR